MSRLYLLLVMLFVHTSATAALAISPPTIHSSESNYELSLVAKGVDVPWAMVMLPNQEILVTDRKGEIRVIRQGKLLEKKVAGVPEVYAKNQGGLLDLALHPKFATNRWLYFSFARAGKGEEESANTVVMRAKYADFRLTDHEVIYAAEPYADTNYHFGSRLAFDQQGLLYFSIGDRGYRETHPQSLDKDAGKIYRVHDDGRIPKDNPFVKQAKPAIYSYGHRNPQGMIQHPITGEIWAHEHGPQGGDELNIIAPGKNYGWPVISYGINYSGTKFTEITAKAGMEQPIWYWVPSIAPSGMIYVTSQRYPEWQGHLLIGSLKFQQLVLVALQKQQVTHHYQLYSGFGRVRSLLEGHDGMIYVGIDGKGIYQVTPKK